MTEDISDIAIVIPALDPDEHMAELVEELVNTGFSRIVLVDDGSDPKNRVYFSTCESEYGCSIIRHAVNLGKGVALKSAFNHILKEWSDLTGVVTCDCDGQHSVKDICSAAKLIKLHTDSLILGVRSFDDGSIPFRSRFGNRFTKVVLRLLTGLHVSDTQTGLRGMPVPLIEKYFAATPGERFEYEMNQLLEARDYHIPIVEFPIETIYIESNTGSHFNPFRDSIRIYRTFLRFLLSSVSSFLIDIFMFWLLGILLRPIIKDDLSIRNISVLIVLRTVLARLISSIYNFFINKTRVFKNTKKIAMVAVKYYLLAIVQLGLSAFLVNSVFTEIPYSTVRKIIIDSLLFIVSFIIQREWVFKQEKNDEG